MRRYFKLGKCNCKCDCSSHVCENCLNECETHSTNGWNLRDWQKLRRITILHKTPQQPPYYHEDVVSKQRIMKCDWCNKDNCMILHAYEKSCGLCKVYVCTSDRCKYEYDDFTMNENYGRSGGYFEYHPVACERTSHQDFWILK
jgi:hypothetical protein